MPNNKAYEFHDCLIIILSGVEVATQFLLPCSIVPVSIGIRKVVRQALLVIFVALRLGTRSRELERVYHLFWEWKCNDGNMAAVTSPGGTPAAMFMLKRKAVWGKRFVAVGADRSHAFSIP